MTSINLEALDKFYRNSPFNKSGFIMRYGKKGWTINLGYGPTSNQCMKKSFYDNIEMCLSILKDMRDKKKEEPRESWMEEWNLRKLKLELLKQEI